jgi:hypothetical protein
LTGERAGRVLSRETNALRRELQVFRGADAVGESGRPHCGRRKRETSVDPARSETPSMHASTVHGNREIPGPTASERDAVRTGKPKGVRR